MTKRRNEKKKRKRNGRKLGNFGGGLTSNSKCF